MTATTNLARLTTSAAPGWLRRALPWLAGTDRPLARLALGPGGTEGARTIA